MAFTGLQHVVAAKVATETPGAALTYNAGMVIGKAIAADITWTRNDNPLYADDAIAEEDNGVTGGEIRLNLDDLLDDGRVYVLGDEENTVDAQKEYETTDQASPYVGLGYIRVRRKAGVTTYQANWIHKVQFNENDESAQTKGEQIDWQTPTLVGKIFGVNNDGQNAQHYRRRRNFNTLADAVAWVDGKAGL